MRRFVSGVMLMLGVIALAANFIETPVWAVEEKATPGNEGGSGGHGIKVNGAWRLYDFFEMGINDIAALTKEDYEFARSQPGYEHMMQYLTKKLENLGDKELIEGFAVTLFRVSQIDICFAETLKTAVYDLSWNGVETPLNQVPIENPTIILDGYEITQLAVRNGLSITIFLPMLRQLPLIDRIGMLVHENVSTFVDIETRRDDQGHEYQWQDAKKMREITGAVFRKDYLEGQSTASVIANRVPSCYRQQVYLDVTDRDVLGDYFMIQEPRICVSATRDFARRVCHTFSKTDYQRPYYCEKYLRGNRYYRILYPRYHVFIDSYETRDGFQKQAFRWEDEGLRLFLDKPNGRYEEGTDVETCTKGMQFAWDYFESSYFIKPWRP